MPWASTRISVSSRPAGASPAHLPQPGPQLVGHRAELQSLAEWLLHHRTATAIVAVSGPPGSGKTALAVHWGRHAVGQHFSGGHLYLDLGSSGPGGAVEPADALRHALEALGVHDYDMPAGIHARVGLYRTLLAGRRILVVLDDARDARQIRPLLPNSPGSAVLVTSRSHLTALVVTEGARSIRLDPPALPGSPGCPADRLSDQLEC